MLPQQRRIERRPLLCRASSRLVAVVSGQPPHGARRSSLRREHRVASNTGPSTQTRFIAGPAGVCTATAQPAQPPTAQAMNSSSATWQGNWNSRASRAVAASIGVGPQAKISVSASAAGGSAASQARASSVT